MKTYIGIDNGVSGSIGIIDKDGRSYFFETPTHKELNYTKKKQYLQRISGRELRELLRNFIGDPCLAIIERPLVNPQRFKATQSALRALEATLIVLEDLEIPYRYEDSKKWQRELLPEGVRGDELKPASRDIGKRLFPRHAESIDKHKDCDGLLIAEYGRRNGL